MTGDATFEASLYRLSLALLAVGAVVTAAVLVRAVSHE